MSFLLTIGAIMTLSFLRSAYREFEGQTYRASRTVGVVVFLVVFCALAWVGALAWEHKLPAYLNEGPLGVVTGCCGVLTFAALFVVPTTLAWLLAQALAGAWWMGRGHHSA